MIDQKENIRNNILDSILILLFLFFVLSFCNDRSDHFLNRTKHDSSNENTVSQSNAVVYPCISFSATIKSRPTGIIYPEVIEYGKNIISENRKTDNQISIQSFSMAKTGNTLIYIFHYHFFATEKDDIPLSG